MTVIKVNLMIDQYGNVVVLDDLLEHEHLHQSIRAFGAKAVFADAVTLAIRQHKFGVYEVQMSNVHDSYMQESCEITMFSSEALGAIKASE